MSDIPNVADIYKAYGPRLLSVLTGILGTHNFALAEDVVQDAFSKAISEWQHKGMPDNPEAWLLTTARHGAIDTIRKYKTQRKFAPQLTHQLSSDWTACSVIDKAFSPQHMHEDQLRMMFVCCHPSIKPANRIVFILRHLCGLSLPAIGRALLLPADTIKKRLSRTRRQIAPLPFALPALEARVTAMDSMHTVLYLVFNEGFHGSGEQALDLGLCREALELVGLLLDTADLANQDTLSVYALMHYHLARAPTRVDASGELLALNQQNRQHWLHDKIALADKIMRVADCQPPATGRFYLEASIARLHCHAARFEQTPWASIVGLYDMLHHITASPVARINQAIALGYAGQPEQGMSLVNEVKDHPVLTHSHMPLATLAHLHAQQGNEEQAYAFAQQALAKGGTAKEHRLMMHQLAALLAMRMSGSDALPQ